jgi:hypothetical protein
MNNLMNEPEIFPYHKEQGQILTEGHYVPNLFQAVGFASRCWKADGSFDTDQAIRLCNELCAYVRLIKEGKAE